jgi:heat shock protein HslJ
MRIRRATGIAFIGACLPLILGACGTSTPSSSGSDVTFDDVVALTFTSTNVQENGASRPLASEAPITLSFTEDGISMNAGCNTLFGGATIDAGRLSVSPALASSLMMCEDPLMEQDEWLTAFLNASPRIMKSDDTLTLTTDDSTIEFELLETIGMFDTPMYGPEELPRVQALCDQLVADGATVEEARAAAENQGYIFRITSEDGESLPATMDANPGRLSVDVEGGIVTTCTAG